MKSLISFITRFDDDDGGVVVVMVMMMTTTTMARVKQPLDCLNKNNKQPIKFSKQLWYNPNEITDEHNNEDTMIGL